MSEKRYNYEVKLSEDGPVSKLYTDGEMNESWLAVDILRRYEAASHEYQDSLEVWIRDEDIEEWSRYIVKGEWVRKYRAVDAKFASNGDGYFKKQRIMQLARDHWSSDDFL